MSLENVALEKIESMILKNKSWFDYINDQKENNYVVYKLVTNHMNTILEKVKNIIFTSIAEINDGYTILGQHVNDCDEYGYIYDVYCKNGWDGQNHDIRSAIKKDILCYYNKIIQSGIEVDNKIYYLHEKILFDDNIELIDEESHKLKLLRHDRLTEIKNQFIKEYKEFRAAEYKKKTIPYWNNYKYYNYGLLYCWNKEQFINALYRMSNFNRYVYNRDNKDDSYDKILQYVNRAFLRYTSIRYENI